MIEKLRTQFGTRNLVLGGIALAAVLVFLFYQMSRDVAWSDEGAPTAADAPDPAKAAPVAAAPTPAAGPGENQGLTAHGVIRSRDQAVLASRLTALITALPFEPGQSFRRGQLLVAFDCSQMRAQLNAANAAAAAYRTTYDTNAELDRYKAIGTNEVLVSRANLNKALAEAEALRAVTTQCQITAPFDGMVVERQAHNHDVAASGQPLMTIQRTGNLEAELIVPSNWLNWLKPGTPFDFTLEETGNTISGKIARLGAAVDPVSKTIRVTGSIVVSGTVLPGMSGTGRFTRHGDAPAAGASAATRAQPTDATAPGGANPARP